MNMNKAVIIGAKAKNTEFIDCNIRGQVENEGRNTSFIRTTISNFAKQPTWLKILEILGILASVVSASFAVLQYFHK